MTPFKINFEGMDRDKMIEAYAQMMIDQLSEGAPSDAYIEATIARDGRDYVAKLKISSLQLSYFVTQKARSPFMALEKVRIAARDEIIQWCYQRYNYVGDDVLANE